MPAMGFDVARIPQGGDSSPETLAMIHDAAQTFLKGAPVIRDTDGEIITTGADPAEVYGVALAPANSSPGLNMSHDNQVTVRTGVTRKVPVALAQGNIFKGRGVNGGTDPVVPLVTHIGEQYGIAQSGGIWYIDFAETSTLVVEIIDIVPAQGNSHGFFIFKFLPEVIQAGS